MALTIRLPAANGSRSFTPAEGKLNRPRWELKVFIIDGALPTCAGERLYLISKQGTRQMQVVHVPAQPIHIRYALAGAKVFPYASTAVLAAARGVSL
jgi:hypothetical protein